jgi:cell division protein FtsI/penicillin-binding protein 2
MLSNKNYLKEAAWVQNSYKLCIAKIRGNIYDCHKNLLTNEENKITSCIIPSENTLNILKTRIPKAKIDEITDFFEKKEPFLWDLGEEINEIDEKNSIRCFKVPKRYSKESICPHIIGHLNNSDEGVCGIEKAYNDFLTESNSEISVSYKKNAMGEVLPGEEVEVTDTSALMKRGIVLTIDKKIQNIAQNAMKKYINKGACVILEVPTAKIRACVSLPDFSPEDIPKVLKDENSPLVNRAFCSYNLGSIFKLVTAATALESGISEKNTHDCSGSFNVEGKDFHCFASKPHNMLNMTEAIQFSCNSYFINLALKLQPEKLYNLSTLLGFNKSCILAPYITSAQGNLPTVEDLHNKQVMANFSFGQGELLATPLQVAGLINTIASNGKYTAPSLIEGKLEQNSEYIEKTQPNNPKQILSRKTTQVLKKAMYDSVENGTSAKGKPNLEEAGAKTSTAETGIIKEGRKVIQAWYAGFYPYSTPKYVISILGEDGIGGGETCGPVFREICDEIIGDS